MKSNYIKLLIILFLVIIETAVWAAREHKPFILAYKTTGDLPTVAEEVKQKLEQGGFIIAGVYTPYESTVIIGITNDGILKVAAKSQRGGFAAAQRVSIVKTNNEVQVAYTNPIYMSHAYRLQNELREAANLLQTILGAEKEFGPEEGLNPEDLEEYSYTIMHPEFDQPVELASYASYNEAVEKVEKGLREAKFGATKVYRVDVRNKEETLFGVALGVDDKGRNDGSDPFIMKEVDFKPIKSAAHLPYDILVSGKKVYALPAEFRIAISFPDLSMMGDNSFMNIMDCPDVIAEMLAHTAGNTEYEH